MLKQLNKFLNIFQLGTVELGEDKIESVIRLFKKHRIKCEKGLSESEIKTIEEKYNFIFPREYREILLIVLPIGGQFVNWRTISDEKLNEKMKWSDDGIVFDIESNNFWFDKWGDKPETIEKQIEIAKKELKNYPKLIPIFGHRYIAESPYGDSGPVLSVRQTDIVYYGENIFDYLFVELEEKEYNIDYDRIKKIEFWSEVIELNDKISDERIKPQK